jgi:hypothetical protein
MHKLLIAMALSLMPATAAFAGPASDAVKFFYAPDANETDPANRGRFTDPAASKLAEYDRSAEGGELGCIDWVMAIDAQDVNEEELARTLKLEEKVSGDDATVTARFKLFPTPDDAERSVIWTLKKVGGAWKVADIATADWALSKLECAL